MIGDFDHVRLKIGSEEGRVPRCDRDCAGGKCDTVEPLGALQEVKVEQLIALECKRDRDEPGADVDV